MSVSRSVSHPSCFAHGERQRLQRALTEHFYLEVGYIIFTASIMANSHKCIQFSHINVVKPWSYFVYFRISMTLIMTLVSSTYWAVFPIWRVVKNSRRRLKIIIIFTESPNTASPRTGPRTATSPYKHARPTGGTLNPVLFLFVCLSIHNTGHAPRVGPASWLISRLHLKCWSEAESQCGTLASDTDLSYFYIFQQCGEPAREC